MTEPNLSRGSLSIFDIEYDDITYTNAVFPKNTDYFVWGLWVNEDGSGKFKYQVNGTDEIKEISLSAGILK